MHSFDSESPQVSTEFQCVSLYVLGEVSGACGTGGARGGERLPSSTEISHTRQAVGSFPVRVRVVRLHPSSSSDKAGVGRVDGQDGPRPRSMDLYSTT